jgi:hypothetical protein
MISEPINLKLDTYEEDINHLINFNRQKMELTKIHTFILNLRNDNEDFPHQAFIELPAEYFFDGKYD